jgi:hypothetical protein
MATKVLDAFISLFADDTKLRESFQGLVPEAKRAGLSISEAFGQGMRGGPSGGPQEASQGPLGGGQIDPAKFKPLFDKGPVDDYRFSVRDAAGTVHILAGNILSELNPALGQFGSVGLEAIRHLRDMGIGMAAGGAAAAASALALALWVGRVKEGIDAQVALANAIRRGNFSAVSGLIDKTDTAIGKFEKQAELAAQQITGIKSASEIVVSYWANVFGPGIDELRDRMAKETEAAKKLFVTQGAPKWQGEDLAFRRRHLDALIALNQASLDAEGTQTRSLAEAFRARTDLLRAETQSQLDALAEQSATKRNVIQERLKVALDPERLQLERDLINITQEETAKRTEIQAQAIGKSIQLFEQDRQARIKMSTDLFAIEKTLGTQAADAEVERWAKVARAAAAGSQVQIDALNKVAQAQKDLQTAGQSLLDQSLSAVDAEAARKGKPSPKWISKDQIASATRDQERRAAETQRTFDRGGRVLRVDFDRIKPAMQLKELADQFGDTMQTVLAEATTAAWTPIPGAFEAKIGAPLAAAVTSATDAANERFTGLAIGLSGSFGKIGEEIRAALTSPLDALDTRITGLASGMSGAFSQMGESIRTSMQGVLDDLDSGASKIIQSIADQVEEKITRQLEASTRAQ